MIRQRGYGIDSEERELGVRCVAAPVFGGDGDAVAAVSISGPSGRVSAEREEGLSQRVRAAASEISERLGYRAHITVG